MIETKTKHFEATYVKLLKEILYTGVYKETRNGGTYSLFGKSFTIDMSDGQYFPVVQGRKIFYKGVFGEFAAMIRQPKCLADFEKWGCNYWKQWANEDGTIDIDYGNAWKDFNGVDQIDNVRKALLTNPNDRRMIVSGWRPDRLDELSLPCCHNMYQWRVNGQTLDMIWNQRSVDMMVGLPSDIVLAAVWNIMLANETGYKPGKITFMLGDTHIYEKHVQMCEAYISNFEMNLDVEPVRYKLTTNKGKPLESFEPQDIVLDYSCGPRLHLEVIS